jgi:dihydrolipoamide dehydrogenase
MAPTEFDVVVIGAGPGGYVAAIRCSQLGLKTAIAEKEALGGICLNWGCIPTKALLKSAERFLHLKKNHGGLFKFDNLGFDWGAIIQASRKTTEQMSKGVEFLMKKNNIQVFPGMARFKKSDLLEIEGPDGKKTEVKAKNTIIAAGAKTASLPGVKIDGKMVISSREAMVLPERPKSIAVIGGGAIGLEFAYFFNAFGVETTVLEYMPRLLPAGDEEVCQELEKLLKRQGMKIQTGAAVKTVEGQPGAVKVTYEKDGKPATVEAEVALMAIGVRPFTDGFGLEGIGVKVGRGGIEVNAQCQTSVPNVFAIGDVIGQPMLAHAASAEGLVAAEAIAGKKPHPIDYTNVPACVYCQPQVGSVGLTEKQARDAGHDVVVGKFPFRVNGKSVAIGEMDGFVKLIGDKKYGEILGAHIIGSEATEMIAELGAARAAELTIHDLHHTIHAHPTQSEAVMEAAGVWMGQAIHI